MILSNRGQQSLGKWRASLVLSALGCTVMGLAFGGCGAPERAVGDGDSGNSTTEVTSSTAAPTTTSNGENTTISTTEDPTLSIPETSDDSDDETEVEDTTGPLGVDGEFCSDFAIEFVTRVPKVYILVDQSSSMFTAINTGGAQTNLWDPLKAGVLDVVEALQDDVRFGFATYTGTQTMCTGIQTSTPIDRHNFEAIKATYDSQADIMIPNDFQSKGETPTPAALLEVVKTLLADEVPGDAYIFLVTDGDPDFCDDNLSDCAVDATIAALQYAYAQGIKSFVFGIDNMNIKSPDFFDFFAQGGVGESPDWSEGLDVLAYSGPMQSKCEGSATVPLWAELRELNGHAPPVDSCGTNQPPEGNTACYQPAAIYSTTGGTATAFLDPDPASIAAKILSEVEALKSCLIEVNFAVEAGQEDKGEIYVGDLTVAIPANEWRMTSPSTIELLGASCDLWLSPDTQDFFAGFPCEVIVEQPIDPIIR